MQVVELGIHRVFAEAVMRDEGTVIRAERVGMAHEHWTRSARAC